MIRGEQLRAARQRYREIAPVLNEQSRRRFVAMEARALGHGGVSAMARVSGLARSTIYHGLSDIRSKMSALPARVRKPGGGRKSKASDRALVADLKRLVEPSTRGDPSKPLLWTSLSLRRLSQELAKRGHQICPRVVGELLRRLGYSLQANSKTKEGGNTSIVTRNSTTSTPRRKPSWRRKNLSYRSIRRRRNWSEITGITGGNGG